MPDTTTPYLHLAKTWTDKHRKRATRLLKVHKQALEGASNKAKKTVLGTGAGLLLLAKPTPLLNIANIPNLVKEKLIGQEAFFVMDLKPNVPTEIRPLTTVEEKQVADVLTRYTGIKVAAELDGKRLNTDYGLIGAEQHLARYPGDTMNTHFENHDDVQKYASSGMAPGLGAWGYFARSSTTMTSTDVDREKYYIAVQTFLSEGFASNFREYMSFYKYRKMLVVNPQNGKALVADIADSGPSEWTGKHLGGSPEVMKYLERRDGGDKGPVLYFFVDDPSNTVPLGPVTLNAQESASQSATIQ
jgi:hypothetical protein